MIKVGEKEYSQRELAKQIGVTDSCVSYVMSGARSPSLSLAIKFAKAMGISVDKLTRILEAKRLLRARRERRRRNKVIAIIK